MRISKTVIIVMACAMHNRACGCAYTHVIHSGVCAEIETEPACNSIKGAEDSVVSSAMDDFSDLLSILSMHHVPSGLTSIGERIKHEARLINAGGLKHKIRHVRGSVKTSGTVGRGDSDGINEVMR